MPASELQLGAPRHAMASTKLSQQSQSKRLEKLAARPHVTLARPLRYSAICVSVEVRQAELQSAANESRNGLTSHNLNHKNEIDSRFYDA